MKWTTTKYFSFKNMKSKNIYLLKKMTRISKIIKKLENLENLTIEDFTKIFKKHYVKSDCIEIEIDKLYIAVFLSNYINDELSIYSNYLKTKNGASLYIFPFIKEKNHFRKFMVRTFQRNNGIETLNFDESEFLDFLKRQLKDGFDFLKKLYINKEIQFFNYELIENFDFMSFDKFSSLIDKIEMEKLIILSLQLGNEIVDNDSKLYAIQEIQEINGDFIKKWE